MMLTQEGYKERVIDKKVTELLAEFGAVCIEGPKWCGKTWTALNHANSAVFIADPAGNFRNRETARHDPSLILEGKPPLVIDEWREVPGIWDAVRFTVDRKKNKGRFILTGSVTPPEESYIHSGAGRIAKVRMRTMSLFESGDSSGSVSIKNIFAGAKLKPRKSSMILDRLIELSLKGGWPALASGRKPVKTSSLPIQYLERIADTEISAIEGRRRNPSKLMAVIRSLARNNATLVNNKTIQKDIGPDGEENNINRNTIALYLSLLKSLYVLEEIPGWDPGLRSSKRLRISPKRVLTDPSLAAAAMGATFQGLKRDLNTFGFIFEGLCIRDISVYAEMYGASLFYYRDDTDLEADLVLELPDGQWGAIEIKLGAHQTDTAALSLMKLGGKMRKNGIQAPAFLAVVSGLGGAAYQREDGVYVIPIDTLGP